MRSTLALSNMRRMGLVNRNACVGHLLIKYLLVNEKLGSLFNREFFRYKI